MSKLISRMLGGLLLVALAAAQCSAVQLKISRNVLQRTLKRQLFSGPSGRYYLNGNAQTPCFAYAEDAQLSFSQNRVIVLIKTHAKLGKAMGGSCLGMSLSSSPEVSLAPIGVNEVIGFRDARLDKVADQKELDFLLTPFLSRILPSSMEVNAADLLRKALIGSAATSGFKVTLDKLKIYSIQIQGDYLVVNFDGDLSVE